MPPLRFLGSCLAVRSEERAVCLANVKVVEAFLLTATFGTPAGLGLRVLSPVVLIYL